MTNQMPIVSKGATLVPFASDDIAPPLAPLAMPKQVLQAESGMIGRMFGLLLARAALLKHGFGRVN